MGIYAYSLFTYLLTALLSFGVIGIIVGLTKLLGADEEGADAQSD